MLNIQIGKRSRAVKVAEWVVGIPHGGLKNIVQFARTLMSNECTFGVQYLPNTSNTHSSVADESFQLTHV